MAKHLPKYAGIEREAVADADKLRSFSQADTASMTEREFTTYVRRLRDTLRAAWLRDQQPS